MCGVTVSRRVRRCRHPLSGCPARQEIEVSLQRGEEYKDGGQGDEVGQGPP